MSSQLTSGRVIKQEPAGQLLTQLGGSLQLVAQLDLAQGVEAARLSTAAVPREGLLLLLSGFEARARWAWRGGGEATMPSRNVRSPGTWRKMALQSAGMMASTAGARGCTAAAKAAAPCSVLIRP